MSPERIFLLDKRGRNVYLESLNMLIVLPVVSCHSIEAKLRPGVFYAFEVWK